MPVIRSTPENKRRVRTGCLACRKRRRKCTAECPSPTSCASYLTAYFVGDEGKPSCTSCQTRRVQCAYPDMLFIPKIGVEVPFSQGSYTRIRFVHEQEPSSPIPKATQSRSSHSSSPASRTTPLLPTPASITIDSLLTTTLVHEPGQQQSGPSSEEQPLLHWDGYFNTNGVSESRQYAALLRYFRYKMAPWMEADDPKGRFGAECMFLAQEHSFLESAMLDVAAKRNGVLRQRGRTEPSSWHRDEPISFRRRCGESVHHVADSLYATARYLGAGVEIWREVSSKQVAMLRGASCPCAAQEPLQTLIRLHSRFGMSR
ncbi:hypothetical protein E4U55_003127 [Claviceps digitariae]|nr:hypothetical protein E4U55_003127 [Claviceps digitariae]